MNGSVVGSSNLRQPLLGNDAPGDDEEQQQLLQQQQEQRTAAILEEWNASVSAFVAENGGDDNVSCYLTEDVLEPQTATTTTTTTDGQTCGDYSTEDRRQNHSDHNDDDDGTGGGYWPAITASKLAAICQATLLPDVLPGFGSGDDNDDDDDDNPERQQQPLRQRRLMESGAAYAKFLKLVVLTFGSIALVRRAVLEVGISDRDRSLDFSEILRYEGDSILRDLAVFFVVGRLHHRRGIDSLEWLGFGLLANLYFESQAFVGWMQHSVTPYEMHCLWPWQLWAFAAVVVAGIAGLVVAHVVAAVREGCLRIAALEFLASVGFFVLPVAASPYAHFHHWFAGWLFGMHANLHHAWWSRAAMAYCWGMYVNGIAVYGRDPLLTCYYARFLAIDQNCPVPWDEPPPAWTPRGILADLAFLVVRGGGGGDDPGAAPDWRNCSSSGYHP